MRVFFDASVIIAALLSPSGGSSILINYARQKLLIGITSQTVIEEIIEEDKFEKIQKTKEEIEKFIAESQLLVRKALNPTEIDQYEGQIDLEDAHLIAGAKLTSCEYLVSLDKKHLLRADIKKKFLPLKIVSPKELLEEII